MQSALSAEWSPFLPLARGLHVAGKFSCYYTAVPPARARAAPWLRKNFTHHAARGERTLAVRESTQTFYEQVVKVERAPC